MRRLSLLLVALSVACSNALPSNTARPDVAQDLTATDAPDVSEKRDVADVNDVDDARDGSDASDVRDASDGGDVFEAAVDLGPPPCTSDDDCARSEAGPACDVATGRCAQCRPGNESRCALGEYCVEATGRCAAGCRDDAACEAAAGPGAARAIHCDTFMHRCFVCFLDTHCPAGNICSASSCVPGCSETQPCMRGASCCEGQCTDTQSNRAHCGACGVACAAEHGTAACSLGRCVVTGCTAPYGDCDNDPTNGCETDTRTSPAHCGACGQACVAPATACVMGECSAP